jgi:hypothetical protein
VLENGELELREDVVSVVRILSQLHFVRSIRLKGGMINGTVGISN